MVNIALLLQSLNITMPHSNLILYTTDFNNDIYRKINIVHSKSVPPSVDKVLKKNYFL